MSEREHTLTAWEVDCLKWHGRILTGHDSHWCWDWDCLPIDETCPEFESCTCIIEDVDLPTDGDTEQDE